MVQRRRISSQLTPRALNFARISTNFHKSPSVPFHFTYIYSGLFSYSRVTSAYRLVAFRTLRFVRRFGLAYGRSSRMRIDGERRAYHMALKVQQWHLELGKIINK